jgi:hypothetical protein
VQDRTFAPGSEIRAAYCVWVHRGMATSGQLSEAFAAFALSRARTESPPRTSPGDSSQRLRAELEADRVIVKVEGQVFTEYQFPEGSKYPCFFPLNGPATGRSVTARQTEPYPHHSSVFFGCDRVNGGNYWQEDLDRGRIRGESIRLVKAEGREVVFEQRCRWERPGAEAPFLDDRRITISAPSPARRLIDFEIRLTALTDVRIEKSNHSLFAARLAPDLAVQGGGVLRNSHGDLGESGTFGKSADWMDARGRRGDVTEGLTLLNAPDNPWTPTPWFTRDYGFLSPTPMNWLPEGHLDLAKGSEVRLRYRVLVHADEPSVAELDRIHRDFAATH